MMLMRSLGAAPFDYKTEAVRLAHNSPWTYVLVTFGRDGADPSTLPLGDRDLLESAWNDAVLDRDVAYVAMFDKTQDDFTPVREVTADFITSTPIVAAAVMKKAVGSMGLISTVKKYGPYVAAIGGVLVLVHFVTGAIKRHQASSSSSPS